MNLVPSSLDRSLCTPSSPARVSRVAIACIGLLNPVLPFIAVTVTFLPIPRYLYKRYTLDRRVHLAPCNRDPRETAVTDRRSSTCNREPMKIPGNLSGLDPSTSCGTPWRSRGSRHETAIHHDRLPRDAPRDRAFPAFSLYTMPSFTCRSPCQ